MTRGTASWLPLALALSGCGSSSAARPGGTDAGSGGSQARADATPGVPDSGGSGTVRGEAGTTVLVEKKFTVSPAPADATKGK